MILSKNKILLINPPFFRLYQDEHPHIRYPLSLGYLAGSIKKNTNWKVTVYNADFFPNTDSLKLTEMTSTGFNNYLNNLNDLSKSIWTEVKNTIKHHKPSVIGITCNSQNFKSASQVAQIAKSIDPKIIIIVGGPHPSTYGSNILSDKNIDICVKGEGEETIVELLNILKDKKKLHTVNGICFKQNKKIIENTTRTYIKNLDNLPFPYQNAKSVLKDFNKFPKEAFRNIFATRGCPHQCFFCGSRSIWSRNVRYRSPKNVAQEILYLQRNNINYIRFDDDTFGGMNQQYIVDLCNCLIENCPKIKWECEMNVNVVTDKIVALMKKAGCVLIQLGVESGNNQILKENKKNITIEQAINASKIIKKNKIILQAFFMVGFPQETETSLKDTLNAINKIDANFTIYSIFTPYPGTEAFTFCQNNGLIKNNYDISLHNHQSPLNCFSLYLEPKNFRYLVSKIEKLIDKKNYSLKNTIARSISKIFYLKDLGFIPSIKKLKKLL